MPISILDTVMDTLKGVEKDEATLTVDEGGESVNLFDPEVWEVSGEAFDTTYDSNTGGFLSLFMDKSQGLGSMAKDPDKVVEKVSDIMLEAGGETKDQKISDIISHFKWDSKSAGEADRFGVKGSTQSGGETQLSGVTKSGKRYSFNLLSHKDEDSGEMVYEINGDRFSKENYDATINNIAEKLDAVTLAVDDKYKTAEEGQGGFALSPEEYLSAARQEPKITVGKPYYSEREEKKKPWWQ